MNREPRPGFFTILMKGAPRSPPVRRGDALFPKRCRALSGRKPSMSVVSMSWWLSAAVQAELDAQFCDRDNRMTLDAWPGCRNPEKLSARTAASA